MTRLDRLETVHGHFGERVDKAAQALARGRMRLEEAEQRLAQLQHFRDDYRKGLLAEGQGVMSAFRLRDFNAFMARLDTGISQQEQHIAELRQETERLRQRWETERQRADALERVVDGHRLARDRDEAEAEQQFSDELSLQRYRLRRP